MLAHTSDIVIGGGYRWLSENYSVSRQRDIEQNEKKWLAKEKQENHANPWLRKLR
ncbi:MAG: hypothetical protein AB7S77_10550 [Desulfatirhabdiaceae bacterium]